MGRALALVVIAGAGAAAWAWASSLNADEAPAPSIVDDGQDLLESVVESISGTGAQADANLKAFEDTIGYSEGATYNTLYGGGTFTSYADHPRQLVTAGGYTSSAAGKYQILSETWDDFVRANGPHDFSPSSQDECAVWLIKRRGALSDVRAGRFAEAVAKCAKEWASLPGSPYGQPTRSLDQLISAYEGGGGAVSA